jgi:hypothetical protein
LASRRAVVTQSIGELGRSAASGPFALTAPALPLEAAAGRIVSTDRSRVRHDGVSGAALGDDGRVDGRVVFFTVGSRRTRPGKASASSSRI